MYKYVETAGRDFTAMAQAITAAGGTETSENDPLLPGTHRVVLAD